MSAYLKTRDELRAAPKKWAITGVAGFIGSNLLETLLKLDQTVVGLDNFSTGHHANLDEVRATCTPAQWSRFTFIEGDIRNLTDCQNAVRDCDYVLHQAALGSVPRSIEDPVTSNAANVTGFLNMLVAARDGGVRTFVYAASSSTYGDEPSLPKVEGRIGRPLSPYAVTKYVNELYADVFVRCYGVRTVGLRYFNVFGPRQDPEGAYAAVIPKWVAAMIRNEPAVVNGDGETTRDFCYVNNVVQANLLAATATSEEAGGQVYNVAVHARTSLNQLFALLRERLQPHCPHLSDCKLTLHPFRPGDVRHSEADISKARRLLGYEPTHTVSAGLDEAVAWYRRQSWAKIQTAA